MDEIRAYGSMVLADDSPAPQRPRRDTALPCISKIRALQTAVFHA
jgi:hypothetical protein